jgi:hypothetical protein
LTVPLADILASLDKVQGSALPNVRTRTKPGELTLLRALADQVRALLDAEDAGRHAAPVE